MGWVQVVGQLGVGVVDFWCGCGVFFGVGFVVGDQFVVVEEIVIFWMFYYWVGGDVGGNVVGCEGFRQVGFQGVG